MGAWIRPDGKWKFIPDHFEYMRAHLTEFGFKKKDAALFSLGNRTTLIEKATERGWIRIRGKSPDLSFEFWRLTPDVVFRIKQFLVTEKINPDEQMLFEEDAPGPRREKSWYRPARWILDDDALSVAQNPRRRR